MIVGIHQPQYLPWLGYLDKIHKSDVFVLLDNVQFKKNEWQNRNRIQSAANWQWMTVPVIHDFGQKINEVKIDNKINWCSKHLRALEMNYSKAPFFEQYHDDLKLIYSREWEYLADINIYFIMKLMGWFKIDTPVVISSQYKSTDHNTQRLIDLCKTFNGNTYLSGVDGPNYMDMSLFEKNKLDIKIQFFEHPVYKQGNSTEEFISHLAAFDLLFQYGPQAAEILFTQEKMVSI